MAVEVEERKMIAAERLEKKLKLTPMDHRQREVCMTIIYSSNIIII